LVDELINDTLDKYEIIEHLGHGGMAEVYKAYQAHLDRYVAIKVLHSFLDSEKNFLARFQREAKSVAALRHPNIVRVHDFDYDEERGAYYMVMEFIDGPTLKTRLEELATREERMTLSEAARIVTAIGEALEYAHQQGMIHRDVKPANIMFTSDDEVILTDFGIAKMVGMQELTASGAMVGTPAYTSPELAEGRPVDRRSDIYSLGILLYQLVTGKLPFKAETPIGVILKHIREPLPSPRDFQPNLPVELEQVIVRSLEKNPDYRYQTAAEFVKALRQAVADQEIDLPPPTDTKAIQDSTPTSTSLTPPDTVTIVQTPSPTPTPRPKKRRRLSLLIMAVILLLAGAVSLLSFRERLSGALQNLGLRPTTASTSTPDLEATELAATVGALQATVGAPTTTPTPLPTPTPINPTTTSTPDLTATAIADCIYDVKVIDDEPIRHQILMPGQRFVKRWEVENVGTCAWPQGVELTLVSGIDEDVTAMPVIRPLQVEESTEVEITLKAPEGYGLYTSAWQLSGEAMGSFGEELKLSYRVGPTPTPWPTAMPTATPTPTPTPTPRVTTTPPEPLWMSIPNLIECGTLGKGVISWGTGGGPSEEIRFFYSQVDPEFELSAAYREFTGFPHVLTYFTASGDLDFPVPSACGDGDQGRCGSPEEGFEIVWQKVRFTIEDCPE